MYSTEIRVGRIFNTFGPRMLKDDGRVISNFIVQALEGNPLTIYGDGNQTRGFCYVSDLIEGIYKFMNSDYLVQLTWVILKNLQYLNSQKKL